MPEINLEIWTPEIVLQTWLLDQENGVADA